jgi:hypothetical protein
LFVSVLAKITILVRMQARLLIVLLTLAFVVSARRVASSAHKDYGENKAEESFVPPPKRAVLGEVKQRDATEKHVAPLKVLGNSDLAFQQGSPSVDQLSQPGPAMSRSAPPGSTPAQLVQGGSLRTWSFRSPAVEQVQVFLSSEGRPLDADVELWHGPDNTPFKMRVYSENGGLRPFSAVLETPRGPNTVSIRNIGQLEFPISADVFPEEVDQPSDEALSASTVIQGGALRTYPFDPSVDSIEVLLTTDGRPLNARIELLQGPNNNKQVIELYAEDGLDRQFFAILETPGAGNVIRIINTAPVEFPMRAGVVPHSINTNMEPGAIIGGDVVIGGSGGF